MRRPTARPTASSQPPQNPWMRPGSAHLRAATDVPSRISRGQLDSIEQDLTSYDAAVLSFVSEVRMVTGHQLARRLWASRRATDVRARAARRALARLERRRVLDRLARRMGGVRGGSSSIVYGLGPAGRRLLKRRGLETRRLSLPGERYIA